MPVSNYRKCLECDQPIYRQSNARYCSAVCQRIANYPGGISPERADILRVRAGMPPKREDTDPEVIIMEDKIREHTKMIKLLAHHAVMAITQSEVDRVIALLKDQMDKRATISTNLTYYNDDTPISLQPEYVTELQRTHTPPEEEGRGARNAR